MQLFDTHAHLDQPEFDADRVEVIGRARAAGVAHVLSVAIDAKSSAATIALAEHNEGLAAAVGIQPNYGAEAQPGDWEVICGLASHPRVVAIGETGLDRHWDYTPFDVQRELFARHIEIARQQRLPIVIHCREAADDLMPMLRDAARVAPLRGVMHAFSGDANLVAECVALGLHISFAGPVTYTNKSLDALRDAARAVADDRLLIETDSPYLVPHPLRGKQKRNEPALLVHVAQRLADVRGVSLETLAEQTTRNAQDLFRREG
ncbi:MAG: TatD family hydrolase [Planctomycetota bacterium]